MTTLAPSRWSFANVPPSDLRGDSADNLAGGALALWQRLQQRTPGKASVTAYNPDAARDGWESPHSVIEIVNDDMPFLVDSVTAEINRHEAEVMLVIHPIVSLRRDAKGKLLALAPAKTAKPRLGPANGFAGESVMQIQITEQPPKRLAEIAAGISAVLADVRAAVSSVLNTLERDRLIERTRDTDAVADLLDDDRHFFETGLPRGQEATLASREPPCGIRAANTMRSYDFLDAL